MIFFTFSEHARSSLLGPFRSLFKLISEFSELSVRFQVQIWARIGRQFTVDVFFPEIEANLNLK